MVIRKGESPLMDKKGERALWWIKKGEIKKGERAL